MQWRLNSKAHLLNDLFRKLVSLGLRSLKITIVRKARQTSPSLHNPPIRHSDLQAIRRTTALRRRELKRRRDVPHLEILVTLVVAATFAERGTERVEGPATDAGSDEGRVGERQIADVGARKGLAGGAEAVADAEDHIDLKRSRVSAGSPRRTISGRLRERTLTV